MQSALGTCHDTAVWQHLFPELIKERGDGRQLRREVERLLAAMRKRGQRSYHEFLSLWEVWCDNWMFNDIERIVKTGLVTGE